MKASPPEAMDIGFCVWECWHTCLMLFIFLSWISDMQIAKLDSVNLLPEFPTLNPTL
jgi:hypothetical protein